MFENKLGSLSQKEFELIYRDLGSPHTILQLLPDECQQIFNILLCMNKPVPHDMIIRSFINSHGVAGDNRKPEELVDDYLSQLLRYHVFELNTVQDGSLQYVINPVFRQTYTTCIRTGEHCQWTSENVKEFKAPANESSMFCNNTYNRNIAILMNPVLPVSSEMNHGNENRAVLDLFMRYVLLVALHSQLLVMDIVLC
ncbi:hypothetical protein JH06_0157 [Blastocystis sp. subtype 4]|uniref:hypothetical protein n=1 Tax=Blastocystis sp. subtype 4 TaxID=944170 RepID=UPI0007117F52|nr:hypothetical protein JH06_0157 [Blastocystis sp. subtype 4]KNB46375.1 hypothetical protein JH06_0157 [Blastocystis sp. subtype 4]|eukprot:XP_014529818.1 hypothetical protein JH06_0157 [Blastocystis sp. subtype 4]